MALDDGSPQFKLERVSRTSRGMLPALLISVAAIFVVIAVIKPWPAPVETPDTTSHPLRTNPPASAQPTQPLGESGFFQQCYPTANWRLTAVQDHGTATVRTVWPVAPAFAAAGAGANPVHVYGVDVQAIGFCAPGDAPRTRVARSATISLWRRDASGAIVPVDGARVIDTVLAAQGEVYLAPPTPLADDGQWPVGDYFFEIDRAGAGSSPTWLALRVLAVPGRAPQPSPANSPSRTAWDGVSSAQLGTAHPHAEEAGDVPYLSSGAGR